MYLVTHLQKNLRIIQRSCSLVSIVRFYVQTQFVQNNLKNEINRQTNYCNICDLFKCRRSDDIAHNTAPLYSRNNARR